MLKKFLRDVITLVAGKQAEKITDLLDSEKYINEFLIAKKLDITINQTRNILYKLSDHGLVSSIRKKDKRKGWYTYFWKIEVLSSMVFLKNIFEKRIEQLSNQIKSREMKEFYVCERCNIEFNEENALVYDFVCNECGGIFSRKDNSKVIKDFKKNMDKIEKELRFIEEEIKNQKEKLENRKIREIKKEKEERKAKRKKKNKSLKKTTKKEVMKKSKKIRSPTQLLRVKKISKKKTAKKLKKNKKIHSQTFKQSVKNASPTQLLHIKKKIAKKIRRNRHG